MNKEVRLPNGTSNFVHLGERTDRGYRCEFCDKYEEEYNKQKLPVCKEHKDTMIILLCPICKTNLAIHYVDGAGAIRYWCIKHHGFVANDLKKDSKFDEEGNIKEYWKKENIENRMKEAERLNREFYGKSMTPENKKEKEEYKKGKEVWLKSAKEINRKNLLN